MLKSYHAETRGESPQKGAQEVSAFRAPLRVSSDQGEILVDQNQKVENVVEERVTIGLSFERERIRLYFQLLEMVIKNGEGLAVMNHKGETPLHFAARAKCVHSVFWLCVHGADVNAQTEEGQTALHIAIANGDILSSTTLVSFRSDVTLLGKNGSALDIAVTCNESFRKFLHRLFMTEGRFSGPSRLSPTLRRLRHLRGILCRSIVLPSQVASSAVIHPNLDCCYSLHVVCPCGHASAEPFYVSELVRNSSNPSWLSLDALKLGDFANTTTDIDIYIHAKLSPAHGAGRSVSEITGPYYNIPESDAPLECFLGSKCLTVSSDVGYATGGEEAARKVGAYTGSPVSKFDLVLSRKVCLSELGFIGRVDAISAYLPSNAVVFELHDGYYAQKDVISNLALHLNKGVAFLPQGGSDFGIAYAGGERVRSPNYSTLKKLVATHKYVHRTVKSSTMKSAHQLEESLIRSREFQDRRKYLSSLQKRVDDRRQFLQNSVKGLAKERSSLSELQKGILPRAKTIRKAQIALLGRKKRLEEGKRQMEEERVRILEVKAAVHGRQQCLVRELFCAFPLSWSPTSHTMAICGLTLPNSHDFAGADEELVATALGYVAHTVLILARWFQVPLRYSIVPMGSRSTIRDDILQHPQGVYPLYPRGVVSKWFKYSVYLLNRNIQQILQARNLSVVGFLFTLPNLLAVVNTSESNEILAQYVRQEKPGRSTRSPTEHGE